MNRTIGRVRSALDRGIPMRRWPGLALLLALLGLATAATGGAPEPASNAVQQEVWSDAEITTLRSLWIGSLPPIPADPSNAYADNPRAAALGKKIFFDTRFSANGKVACATCHQPQRNFTDGLARGLGIGEATRNTPSIVGAAYDAWFFWDGRRDSMWAQAMGPLENGQEHGSNRTRLAHILYEDAQYRNAYQTLFGTMPDLSDRKRFPDDAGPVADPQAASAWAAMSVDDRTAVNRIFANATKAVAAFERGILPGSSRFDSYVEGLLQHKPTGTQQTLTVDEIAGLRLFIGKAKCIMCHNGPQFTNHSFHNTAVPAAAGQPRDEGHIKGVKEALADEFNCLGAYSDAGQEDCAELRFAKQSGLVMGAFKVPGLRDVAKTGPYFHTGQFDTLAQVIDHYNQSPNAPVRGSELLQINLTTSETSQLEAFLRTLNSSQIKMQNAK